MFSSVGWGEIAVLVVAGLIILGPERLPDAVSWTLKSLRQVRDYATGATGQLKEELGTDFDEIRKPLAQLNELRGMTPRAIVTKHLLSGDDSVFRMTDEVAAEVKGLDLAQIKPVSAPLPTPVEITATEVAADTAPAQAANASGPDPAKLSDGVRLDKPRTNTRPSVADWDAT